MPETTSPELGYSAQLAALQEARPQLARALALAEENRRRRLARLRDGARLRGADVLLSYLGAVARTYREADELSRIAFLVERAAADFVTAVEAALSGYSAVAADAMRDVMEIELLILDFVREPTGIDVWLTADERVRRRTFKPVKLRERLEAEGVDAYTSTVGQADYAAHSASIHVTPTPAPFLRRGVIPDAPEDLLADAPWWEIFEHAYRLIQAVEALRIRFQIDRGSEAACDLGALWDARGRAFTMQTMYLALLTGPHVLRKTLGREPTEVEVLQFVRDRIAQLGPSGPDGPPPTTSRSPG